jgi:hypothetical protein
MSRAQAATLTRVAGSKKRKTSKRRTQRQGLSGNPERRAEQLRQPLDDGGGALLDFARLMAGGAEPAAWWPESHERILVAAAARAWPSDLADIEALTCELVGDEFYARLNGPETGLHPTQWLVALAESTAAAFRTSLQSGSGDWAGLYALLCGLALIAPLPPDDEASENLTFVREHFPDILDPYEVAQSEAGNAVKLLADRGRATGFVLPSDGARPSGEALVARDAYGSRFLVAVPFGYGDAETDHWYAWDVDQCWTNVPVAAGTFGSAEESLAEWRAAVGGAADASSLAPCAAPLLVALLDPCLRTGAMSDMLQGLEPRELICEFYRMRRRARALVWSAGAPAAASNDHSSDTDTSTDTSTDTDTSTSTRADTRAEAFLEWYTERHGTLPTDFPETLGTLISEWGPGGSTDDRSFYACSPHRIEMTAHLLRDGYLAEHANEALAVLPDWTQWCLTQSDPGPELAARALDTANTEAAELVTDDERTPDDPDEKAPFRRGE